MTSANIAGFVNGRNAGTDISVSSGTGKGGKTAAGGISFASVMEQRGVQVEKQQFTPETRQTSGSTEKPEPASEPVRAGEQFSGKDKPLVKKGADVTEEAASLQDKVTEAEETFEEGVKKILEEELGVTGEQVEEAMAILGISYLELMNPSQLSQLAAQLTGAEDTCQLLMNESFRDIMQQVDALSQNLTQEMGIPKEQLTLFGSQLTETVQTDVHILPETEGADVPKEPSGEPLQEMTPEEKGTALNAEAAMQTQEPQADADASRKTAEVQQPEQEPQKPQEKEPTVIRVNEVLQEEAPMEQSGEHAADLDTGNGRQESGQEKSSMGTQEHAAFTVRNEAAAQTAEAPQPVSYTTADIDVESIMRQISEFARVNFSQENTSLEMQLNPQNLGKLYLHVSTTAEGNVTAQIAATDETVKEVLEAQIADLRTSLNQQGIKVDAIEVTVASHEFERNLEQNAAGEQQQAEDRERQQSGGTRRIFRGELDELSGMMSEEEVLAARIMKDHGNTMDVTA